MDFPGKSCKDIIIYVKALTEHILLLLLIVLIVIIIYNNNFNHDTVKM